jgi:hypothetical protein
MGMCYTYTATNERGVCSTEVAKISPHSEYKKCLQSNILKELKAKEKKKIIKPICLQENLN